jgi:hypothetical protein
MQGPKAAFRTFVGILHAIRFWRVLTRLLCCEIKNRCNYTNGDKPNQHLPVLISCLKSEHSWLSKYNSSVSLNEVREV